MLKHRLNQRLERISSDIWRLINQIDELKGRWIAGASLDAQALGRLKKSVLVTSTGASTRIEGANLSDEDVEKMMRGINIKTFKDRDKQEVQGYFELLENVFNAWQNTKLTESTIKQFHKELLKYVEKDKAHRGEYKKQENKVHMVNEAGESVGVLFDTTPAHLTDKEMQELVEWTKEALKHDQHHPLLIVANFIVEFLNIHPFLDGNGRVSRVLTNLLLLQQGYEYVPYVSHERLVEERKPDYYLALRQSQKTLDTDQETIEPWLKFFLGVVLEQSKQAVDLLSSENIEKLLSENQLRVWSYLNQVAEASPGEIANSANVARPTVNQALNKLMKLKKVERLGLGRSTRYRRVD